MRDVARVLVVDHGRVLAVAHGGDFSRCGIPGGGVDPGERPWDAAARELWEETGLRVLELCEVVVVEEHDRRTFVYAGCVHGALRPSDEGVPFWAEPAMLTAGVYGPFHEEVFAATGTP